jgi:hypothetical protein
MWREIHNICYLYNPVTRLGKWEVIATSFFSLRILYVQHIYTTAELFPREQ